VTRKKSNELDPKAKRARDIRNGVLLAHVVISWAVVAFSHLKWWSVFHRGTLVAEFWGNDEKAFQTGYITLSAIAAFFFTSYDIVTNADIQWPPLLASAFALGCASEVTYKLVSERDVIYQHVAEGAVEKEIHEHPETEPVTARGGVTATLSSEVSTQGSSSRTNSDEGLKLKINYGLYGTLYGTFAMVVLSVYLTFFAKREEGT
jgi:hypothetical protein